MSESKQNSNTYSSFAEVRLPDPSPRKQTGSDRPAIVIQSSMKLDPRQNILFLFCGRKSSTIKGLLWEEDGFMLITKRLENGKFQWPRTEEEVIVLSEQELRWLFDGLSIVQKNAIRPARKRAYMCDGKLYGLIPFGISFKKGGSATRSSISMY